MNKIYITGAVASGKTTLSRKLSEKYDIPCYELDKIVWQKTKDGCYKKTEDEQKREIIEIDKCGSWIIEGTYEENCRQILDMADKIIFLDTSLSKRKWRIFWRFIKQQLKIESSNYKSNIKMLKMMYKWTDDFEHNRSEFENMLSYYENKLAVVKNTEDLNINDMH